MDRKIWLTNRVYGTWVPAPAINFDGSYVGWSTQTNYLDGGAYVRRSNGAHREYNLSWNLGLQSELQPILNFASGMYGNTFMYWSDPFTHNHNVVQRDFSMPGLGASDGVVLTGAVRPLVVQNLALLDYGLPAVTAQYTNIVTANSRKLWIPVPPGYKLLVQAYGSATGNASWRALPQGGTETVLPWASVPGPGRSTFSGVAGVELYLGGSGTNTAVAHGLMAQIVPIAANIPNWTTFEAGTGHSGLRFADMPQMMQYSAVLDRVGLSAKLVETGAWQ